MVNEGTGSRRTDTRPYPHDHCSFRDHKDGIRVRIFEDFFEYLLKKD